MKSLNCPNCGAALPPNTAKADVLTCEFCGTTFRTSDSLTPQPEMGDLILGADFSHKPIPGWTFVYEDKVTLVPGDPPELHAKLEAKPGLFDMLQSSGMFDNFDLSVTIKFLEGNPEWIRAAALMRYAADAGYGVLVSAQGTYKLGYYSKDADGKSTWKDIMGWVTHTSLRSGLNQPNRLRVICNNDRLRVYLNGVLATSIKDTRFEVGRIFLSMEPTKESDILVSYSDLQLREVPK